MDKINVIPFESELILKTPEGKDIKLTGELHNRLNTIFAAYTQLLGVDGLKEVTKRIRNNQLVEGDIYYCYADLMYIIADLEQLFIDNGLAIQRDITSEDKEAMVQLNQDLQSTPATHEYN